MNAPLRAWHAEPLPDDVRRAIDRLARSDDVRHVAVMPDVHLAEDVCIGAVVATERLIYPQAVGGDIGCGMAAIRLESDADVLRDEHAAARVFRGLYRAVPANRHAQAALPLDPGGLSEGRLRRMAERDGRVQFGTLGRGNHFLELQSDEHGQLWLMVHSGSRAMGPAIMRHHLEGAHSGPTGLLFLDAESDAGRAYLADAEWALTYADASRRAMVDALAAVLEIDTDSATYIHCRHNHVCRETHFDKSLYVHRKGAISARDCEWGIIPGSMGTRSYHVQGRGCAGSLTSSSHGAGRAMSRSAARARITSVDFRRQMRGVWFDQRLTRELREEAPSAYKDITAVLRSERELTRIVRTLRPILSYKGV